MEPAAVLDMATNSVKEREFVMHWIVSDDGSVMRAHLRHPKNDKNDKGKLPLHVLEPTFAADPGHRKKAVAKHFYKLASKNVGTSRVNNSIAKRMKKNWGYMIRQNRGKTIEEFMRADNAPLEHLFGNHIYCDPKWCSCLQAQSKNLPYNHPDKFYSQKDEDRKKSTINSPQSPPNTPANSFSSKVCTHSTPKPTKH